MTPYNIPGDVTPKSIEGMWFSKVDTILGEWSLANGCSASSTVGAVPWPVADFSESGFSGSDSKDIETLFASLELWCGATSSGDCGETVRYISKLVLLLTTYFFWS